MTSTFISARSSTESPGLRVAGLIVHGAVVGDGDPAEEVHVRRRGRAGRVPTCRVRRGSCRGRSCDSRCGTPGSGPRRISRDQRGVGAAADRVVPADGVAGDGAEDAAHVGVEDEAGGEARDVLRLERVRHVVALDRALEVVEERADVGAAFDVGDAQRGAALEDVRPRRASWDSLLPQNGRIAHAIVPFVDVIEGAGGYDERREGRSRRPSRSGAGRRRARSLRAYPGLKREPTSRPVSQRAARVRTKSFY